MEDAKTFEIYDKTSKIKALKEINKFVEYWREKEDKVVFVEISISG